MTRGRAWLRGGRLLVLALVAFFLLTAGWVGVRGFIVRREMVAARADVAAVRATVVNEDAGERTRLIARINKRVHRARRLSGDAVWATYGRFPLIGRPLRATHELTLVASALTSQAMPPLVAAAEELAPSRLRPSGDRIGLDALRRARPHVVDALVALKPVREQAFAVPNRGTWVVGRARADLLRELDSLIVDLGVLTDALEVAPRLLGADGLRRYFLAVQNPAEARGTGGLIGSYGIVTADRGQLNLEHIGPNAELLNYPDVHVPVAPDFATRYRPFSSDAFWLNANMTPHLPYANTVVTGLWARGHNGQKIDGTITIDPIAMSYLLAATGPVTLESGVVVDASNVVPLTLKDSYATYANPVERDKFFGAVASACYRALTSGAGDTGAMVHGLGRAVAEGHIQLASNDPATQAVLERMPISGSIPLAKGPFLAVVVNNAAGTKLDYYLQRATRYELRERVDGSGAVATVRVTLRNTAPAKGLPAYVTTRPDLESGESFVPGQNRLFVSVFAGVGAKLEAAAIGRTPFARLEGIPGEPLTLGNTATTLQIETERGHPVFSTFLDIDPGGEVTLHLVIREPMFSRSVVVRSQALVTPEEIAVVVL